MESKVFVTKSVARYTSLLWSPNSPPQEVWLVTLDDLTKLSRGNSGGAAGYAAYAPFLGTGGPFLRESSSTEFSFLGYTTSQF